MKKVIDENMKDMPSPLLQLEIMHNEYEKGTFQKYIEDKKREIKKLDTCQKCYGKGAYYNIPEALEERRERIKTKLKEIHIQDRMNAGLSREAAIECLINFHILLTSDPAINCTCIKSKESLIIDLKKLEDDFIYLKLRSYELNFILKTPFKVVINRHVFRERHELDMLYLYIVHILKINSIFSGPLEVLVKDKIMASNYQAFFIYNFNYADGLFEKQLIWLQNFISEADRHRHPVYIYGKRGIKKETFDALILDDRYKNFIEEDISPKKEDS